MSELPTWMVDEYGEKAAAVMVGLRDEGLRVIDQWFAAKDCQQETARLMEDYGRERDILLEGMRQIRATARSILSIMGEQQMGRAALEQIVSRADWHLDEDWWRKV